MAKKTIAVAMDKEGNIYMDLDNFDDDDCFKAADKIRAELNALGIEVGLKDMKRRAPKIPEVEQEKIRNRH